MGVGVGHEVGREVALVELHALDDLKCGVNGTGLLDGDGAVLAHLVHGVGDDIADGLVPVGGHCGDLLDLLLVLHLGGDVGELAHGRVNGLLYAALNVDGAGAGGYAA